MKSHVYILSPQVAELVIDNEETKQKNKRSLGKKLKNKIGKIKQIM